MRRRRILGLVAVVLVLAAAAASTTTAFANKPVTPKLGLYFGRVVGPPENGDVNVQETEVKVVKIGNRRGAELRVSPFPATCGGALKDQPHGLEVLEKTPIPIKNGKFALDRTTHERVAGGAGTATTRTVVSGTFKSVTKVVVKASVNSSANIQFPEQPEMKGTCTGKHTSAAKHV